MIKLLELLLFLGFVSMLAWGLMFVIEREVNDPDDKE
jgi:hypothetical protein